MQYDFQMPRTITNYHEQSNQLLQVLQFQQLQQHQQHFQFHNHFQQQQQVQHQRHHQQPKPLTVDSPAAVAYSSPDIAVLETTATTAPPPPTTLVTPTTSASPASTSSLTIPTPKRQSRAKSKRVRTIFTPEQLKRLEMEFSNQMYLVGHDRGFLASSLNLTEAQVKVWFQNRRIKHRKLNPSSAPIL